MIEPKPTNEDLNYYNSLPNCSYRYDYIYNPIVDNVTLIVDGPFTLLTAILAVIGLPYSIKFLRSAGLHRDLTAALYCLAICDVLLNISGVFYHTIEAISVYLFNTNIMWNKQNYVLITYGFVSVLTTASTLLVVMISFQRFKVVWWPLSYNNYNERNSRPDIILRRYSNLCNFDKNKKMSFRRMLSPAAIFQRKKVYKFSKNNFRPYVTPLCVIISSIIVNLPVFFEFQLADCISWEYQTVAQYLMPTEMRMTKKYHFIRTVIMMATQTVGPVFTITFITCITEYKLYTSMQERRKLFESQNRQKSVILLEELKETVSRAVAIFIAIKFLLMRTLPVFFDFYETIYGIDSFGTTLSVLVRISDFLVVLNSATNSLAYFGRRQWLENRLKERILKKHIRSEKNSTSQQTLIQKKSIIGGQPGIADV